MALVNTDWISVSSQAIALVTAGKYALISDYVDAEITKDVTRLLIDGEDIPVDQTGYIDSPILQSMVTDLALYRLFLSVAGVRDGQPDVYRDMAYIHEREYREAREKLTRSMIL